MAKTDLTAARLRELLHYNPETGIFWRHASAIARLNNSAKCMQVGYMNPHIGYIFMGVNKEHFYAHRLAWLYMTGEWPIGEIDHINGVKTDNRIENLRDVSRATNAQNMRLGNSANSSGLLGVTAVKAGQYRIKKDQWAATIKTNNVRKYLGCFDTPELAHAAYVEAKRIDHAGCTI